MAKLRELIAYLLLKYPHKAELSNARVTKMVYLCDWKHSLDYGRPITDIEWVFDHYGPFVWDVLDEVTSDPLLFHAEESSTVYGTRKTLFSIANGRYVPSLSLSERQVADHVIAATKDLNWQQFISLVYSTYPIVASERYDVLDLVLLASKYKDTKAYRAYSPA